MDTAKTTATTTATTRRLALVTGATRGLGRAVAEQLAAAGDHVIVTGRRLDDARRVAADLVAGGRSASALVLDVDSPASVRCAADEVRDRWGALDVLVNNAGVLPEATAEPSGFVDAAVAERTWRTNVIGPTSVLDAFLPLVRRSDAGRIVNVSSTMGSMTDQATAGSAYAGVAVPAYRASKAALNSLTLSLAQQLAGTGVVVTAVCPGFVRTDLTPVNRKQAPLDADEAARVVVAAAAPDAAPAGVFVDAAGPVPW